MGRRPKHRPKPPAVQNDNTKYIGATAEIMRLPKADLSNPRSVREVLNKYLEICQKNEMKPLVTGFALAFKMSRSQVIDICRGDYQDHPTISEDSAEIFRNFYYYLNAIWEQCMMTNQVYPASGIFLGKNNFGYKDVTETIVTKKKDTTPKSVIERKYKEIPDD